MEIITEQQRPTPSRTDTMTTAVSPTISTDISPCSSTHPSSTTTATIYHDSTSPQQPEQQQEPDGGLQGWLAVFGSFLIHCFAFAPTEFVFGIFEHHYQEVFPNSSAASIAFVGTTGSAITYIAGFLSGIVADRFGFKRTSLVGTVVMTLSLILASFSSQLWHLYLSQGVLFGVGASLAYYPAIAVPSQYFSKNRGLAVGLAVSGTGAGGFVLAPLTNAMIEKVDIFWSLRILAGLTLVICGGASLLIAERKLDGFVPQEKDEAGMEGQKGIEAELDDPKAQPEQDLKTNNGANKEKRSFFEAAEVFKDPRFMSLTLAELTASLGYLVPLYFMQTYAVFIGLTPERGALILGLSNGSSFAGRIILGVLADRVSNTRVLVFSVWATAVSVMVFWTIATSFWTLVLMGVIFGFFVGGYVSLVPVAVAETFGTKNMASMIGLMYGAGGLAMWGGSPLAGYILDRTGPNTTYLPMIMTTGASLTLGALFVTSWAYFHRRTARLLAAQRVLTIDTLS